MKLKKKIHKLSVKSINKNSLKIAEDQIVQGIVLEYLIAWI